MNYKLLLFSSLLFPTLNNINIHQFNNSSPNNFNKTNECCLQATTYERRDVFCRRPFPDKPHLNFDSFNNNFQDKITETFLYTNSSTNRTNIQLYPKEIFLTFDDGPSAVNTTKIISTLNQYNVKATFFVIGKNAKEHPELLRLLHHNGMCIASHTFTHNYYIYKNLDLYFQDLYECNKVIKETIGDYPPPFVRLPGGSDNSIANKTVMKNIRASLKDRKISYVDWNVSSGDSASIKVPTEIIKESLLRQLKNANFVVMLMHDSNIKTTSSEALPSIISFLKEKGFVFRTFSDISVLEEKKMLDYKIINR